MRRAEKILVVYLLDRNVLFIGLRVIFQASAAWRRQHNLQVWPSMAAPCWGMSRGSFAKTIDAAYDNQVHLFRPNVVSLPSPFRKGMADPSAFHMRSCPERGRIAGHNYRPLQAPGGSSGIDVSKMMRRFPINIWGQLRA
jgi:hypothetical protein